MNFGAHVCFGSVAGAGFMFLAQKNGISPEPVAFMLSCTLGSVLPDIDHPKSYIGRRVPLIPKLLYKTVGHRTLTHSILFTLLASMLLYKLNHAAGIGLWAGITSHIILDICTPFSKGVSLFYPITRKRIGIFKK